MRTAIAIVLALVSAEAKAQPMPDCPFFNPAACERSPSGGGGFDLDHYTTNRIMTFEYSGGGAGSVTVATMPSSPPELKDRTLILHQSGDRLIAVSGLTATECKGIVAVLKDKLRDAECLP